ncbi:hypothetical protein GWK47_005689 [Chionoecetes opilio]|uniref:Uncharacterized protein n=1 Tax=Chionoecetes opilio TaxID=41210 RepID=A0A8J4Y9H9_CHIOP|nr:hypothetical protein GWK47_005689 [Chionoecetes opilio]
MEGQNLILRRGQIVSLLKAGYSPKSIAAKVGVARSTVSKWQKRYEESGNLSDLPKSSRSRVTTPEEDAAILQAAREEDTLKNASALKKRLNLQVSEKTIIRRLRDSGLRCQPPNMEQLIAETVALREKGYSFRAIAKELNVSKTCVVFRIQRFQENGGQLNYLPKRGRGRVASASEDLDPPDTAEHEEALSPSPSAAGGRKAPRRNTRLSGSHREASS